MCNKLGKLWRYSWYLRIPILWFYNQHIRKIRIYDVETRKMSSENGNIGRVNKSIGLLTFKQLDEWGFIYDEIYFGKPAADIYIDDKGFKFNNEEQLKTYIGDLKNES